MKKRKKRWLAFRLEIRLEELTFLHVLVALFSFKLRSFFHHSQTQKKSAAYQQLVASIAQVKMQSFAFDVPESRFTRERYAELVKLYINIRQQKSFIELVLDDLTEFHTFLADTALLKAGYHNTLDLLDFCSEMLGMNKRSWDDVSYAAACSFEFRRC
jgi:hypothetical protein